MDIFGEVHRDTLAQYPRAIVHIRTQFKKKRLGLVFGAGLSKSFNLPSWKQLVSDIAADDDVDGAYLMKGSPPNDSLTYKTEMIYQHFKKRKLHEDGEFSGSPNMRAKEVEISGRWINIVRKHLYPNITDEFETQLDGHPYLNKLIPIIKNSQMTVTYNFDDYIERALLHHRDKDEKEGSKGYEVVTSPWTQFRRTDSVIYHPNGIVPYTPMENPSDRIVFSESSFADQILGQFSGDDSALLSHLSKNTCLFIGLSLQDETLRTLLSKSAMKNPGSFHYYVMYADGKNESSEHQEVIRHTNFKVYNLITLFLNNEGIAALSDFISCDDPEFKDFAGECGTEVHYRFYLTGPLGVGKSTTINHMRNLSTYDEWLDQRIAILGKPWRKLTDIEKKEADDWILNQFKLKNKRLRHNPPGIFIIDRGPMDPLAFTADEERQEKAQKLVDAYSPGESDFVVMPGTLLFLKGDTKELQVRLTMSNREGYTSESLDEMENDLLEVYGKENVREFDTTGLSVKQMVKNIAEIIHLEEYKEMDMQGRLQSFANPAE